MIQGENPEADVVFITVNDNASKIYVLAEGRMFIEEDGSGIILYLQECKER